jgi:hypothetical protein
MFYATGLTGWQRATMGSAPAPTTQGGPGAPLAAVGTQQELARLRQRADGLAASLDEIQRRIEELQGQQATPGPIADQPAG